MVLLQLWLQRIIQHNISLFANIFIIWTHECGGTSSQGISVTRLPEAEQQTLSIPVVRRIEPSKAVSSSVKSAADQIAVMQQSSDTPLKSNKQDIKQLSSAKEIESLEEGAVDGTTAGVESSNKEISNDVIVFTPPEEIENLFYDYFEIPKGHVWLAGDNVANSTDSRWGILVFMSDWRPVWLRFKSKG